MDAPIYQCLGCDKSWFSLSARYKEHINAKHNGNMSLIKDNRDQFGIQLKSLVKIMFPRGRLPMNSSVGAVG